MSEIPDRRVVPIEEAIERIGTKKYIHTFMQGGPAVLIGCDHSRTALIAAMKKHGVEESGPGASEMGHTLVIVKYPTLDGAAPLFIEAKPR